MYENRYRYLTTGNDCTRSYILHRKVLSIGVLLFGGRYILCDSEGGCNNVVVIADINTLIYMCVRHYIIVYILTL